MTGFVDWFSFVSSKSSRLIASDVVNPENGGRLADDLRSSKHCRRHELALYLSLSLCVCKL